MFWSRLPRRVFVSLQQKNEKSDELLSARGRHSPRHNLEISINIAKENAMKGKYPKISREKSNPFVKRVIQIYGILKLKYDFCDATACSNIHY